MIIIRKIKGGYVVRIADSYMSWALSSGLYDYDEHCYIDITPLIADGALDGSVFNREIAPLRPPYSRVLFYGKLSNPVIHAMGNMAVSVQETIEDGRVYLVFLVALCFSADEWEPMAEICVPLNDDGYLVETEAEADTAGFYVKYAPYVTKMDAPEAKEAAEELIYNRFSIILYVLQLLNCKNIELTPHDPMDSVPSRIRRHWERKGREPLKKHYTLSVRVPGRKKKGAVAEINDHKSIRPLHTCRGHFSTYTDEGKLFGKYSGTFWVPAHVRGSVRHGEITKDYRLKQGDGL